MNKYDKNINSAYHLNTEGRKKKEIDLQLYSGVHKQKYKKTKKKDILALVN